MEFANLLLECRDGIAELTINRPAVRNALNAATLSEIGQAFRAFDVDPAVRTVILTGAGERAFAAGGDISAVVGFSPLQARDFARFAQAVLDTVEQCSKPVIAAVNGFAVGGGCELAMACDLRLAAASARFGQPEINLGILAGWAGTQRLPRLVGRGRALELLLSGELIAADEAWRIGLVNRVVAPVELLSAARSLARTLATKSAAAVRLIKSVAQNGTGAGYGPRRCWRGRTLRSRFCRVRSPGGDGRVSGKAPAAVSRSLTGRNDSAARSALAAPLLQKVAQQRKVLFFRPAKGGEQRGQLPICDLDGIVEMDLDEILLQAYGQPQGLLFRTTPGLNSGQEFPGLAQGILDLCQGNPAHSEALQVRNLQCLIELQAVINLIGSQTAKESAHLRSIFRPGRQKSVDTVHPILDLAAIVQQRPHGNPFRLGFTTCSRFS